MSVRSMYDQRRMDPADAVRVVRDGDTIVLPIGAVSARADLGGLRARHRLAQASHRAHIASHQVSTAAGMPNPPPPGD